MTVMRKKTLGRTGLQVSPIALGGAVFGYENRTHDWNPWSSQGRSLAIQAIHHAIDRGLNYIDTAPLYGDGNSESIVGEVMRTRRGECVLATKVWFEKDRKGVIESVHDSLKRLQTDYIDIVQVHGRMYDQAYYKHIVDGGPLAGLNELKAQGKIGFIGLTSEEPWSCLQFLPHREIDLYQIAYNFIYQAAARHFLIDATKADAAIVTMRTMTSGVMQRIASYIAPEWQGAHDLYDVSLKFVLSDSRVHSAIIGMRWPEEVERNIQTVENWVPPFDLATLPRLTGEIYKTEDAG
ncbi:MAG: aldo/keto reductase [Alphaproteobacteria bacterium]|nr:aldo/keto reductase [Alphaproteobacteria bacterium]